MKHFIVLVWAAGTNDLIVPVKLGHANTQMVYDVYVNYLDKQFDDFDKSIEVYK